MQETENGLRTWHTEAFQTYVIIRVAITRGVSAWAEILSGSRSRQSVCVIDLSASLNKYLPLHGWLSGKTTRISILITEFSAPGETQPKGRGFSI